MNTLEAEYYEWLTGWDEDNWKRVFANFPAQAEFTVMSTLMIGPSREAYVKFRGRELRWINPKAGSSAVVVLPIPHPDDLKEAYELVLAFLSRVSFETNEGAFISNSATYARRLAPFLLPAKRLFKRYPDGWHPKDPPLPARMELAMGFYREALNTLNESPFFAFLSCYKVLQLAFNEDAAQIEAWIEGSLEPLLGIEQAAHLRSEKGNVAHYLWRAGRCAIAHTKTKPVADPNNIEDLVRLRNDMWLVQALAQSAIRTQAGRLGVV